MDDATFDAYAARAGAPGGGRRLHLARAGDGDDPRPGLRRGRSRPPAAHVLRRRADARLAGPRAGRPSPTCCCSTSRPTTSTSPRWSGWSSSSSRWTRRSCSSPTTAGSWRRSAPRCWRSRRAARRFFAGPWHAWRQEQAARELALGRAIDKQAKEIERMERFVERFRAKATKARQAQSRVKALDKIERIERDPRDGRELAFSFKPPERSGRVVYELTGARLEVPGRVAGRQRRAVAGARRARHARRGQRRGQVDAGQGALGPARVRRGQALDRATTCRSPSWPSMPRRSTTPARSCRPPSAPPASTRTRRARCWAASCSPARRATSRPTRCRAASASACRWPSSCRAAPTC